MQARDSAGEKRISGGDRFTLAVRNVDRAEVVGRGAITDLDNGLYSAAYSVPLTGTYDVHVTSLDLGSETPSHVRGSPFRIQCADPWTYPRVLGSVPAKRKAATLLPVGDELVMFGGDKGRAYTLSTGDGDWRWNTMAVPDGMKEPSPRTAHGAALAGSNALVVFAGISMDDASELADVWQLTNRGGEWTWAAAAASQPFVRELKRQRALEANKLPDPRPVPTAALAIELTPADGGPFWLSGHKWNAGISHTVALANVDSSITKQVKFYLNADPKIDASAEPVAVATSAPYVMGIETGGEAKAWNFEEGEMYIVAVAEPIAEAGDGGEAVTVREEATVLPEGGVDVRSDSRLSLRAPEAATCAAQRCSRIRRKAAFLVRACFLLR